MGPASMSACRHLHSMSAGKYSNSKLRVHHAVSLHLPWSPTCSVLPLRGGHCVRSLKFALREGPGTQGAREPWEMHCAIPCAIRALTSDANAPRAAHLRRGTNEANPDDVCEFRHRKRQAQMHAAPFSHEVQLGPPKCDTNSCEYNSPFRMTLIGACRRGQMSPKLYLPY